MSEDKATDVLLEWFKNNLPEDYDLQQEIATRAERVFRHVVMRHHQQVNTPIFIGVSNNLEDASRLSITMNVYGIIFLGVMAKAILDSIAGQFQALLSSPISNEVIHKKVREIVSQYVASKDLKKCPNPQCGYHNDAKQSYCGMCGTTLF
jgi:ribosomal protein S27AE